MRAVVIHHFTVVSRRLRLVIGPTRGNDGKRSLFVVTSSRNKPSEFQPSTPQESRTRIDSVDSQECQRGERVEHPWKQHRHVVGMKEAGDIEGTTRTKAGRKKNRCQPFLEWLARPPVNSPFITCWRRQQVRTMHNLQPIYKAGTHVLCSRSNGTRSQGPNATHRFRSPTPTC